VTEAARLSLNTAAYGTASVGVQGASEFRADVEGMRAVAVLLVLLYHARVPLIAAGFLGVDVFFVISGFLITRMLVREVEASGRVSLAGFYARRVKRLLPAAALVLVVTAALVHLLMPRIDRPVFAADVSWAAFYAVNWRLADRSVDYLAEDVGVSPVQHYWSLSVEEQFYLVWPLLLLVVAWWVRRSGWSVRATMAAALSLVALPSLAWSIALTRREPSVAFFVTTTRMWELSIGAFVAIAAPQLARVPRRAAIPIAWLGLAGVVACALIYSQRTPWPGAAALLPTLATAAVLGAGPAAGAAGPVALLGTRPMVWIGGLSYSLYLWHWPFLVVAAVRWRGLSPLETAAVLAVATACAWLAYRLVEDPVRHAPAMARRAWFALSIGAGLSVVGLAVGVLVAWVGGATTGETRRPLGAAVLADPPRDDPAGQPVDRVDWFVPDPLDAPQDTPRDGCQTVAGEATEPMTCTFGDPRGRTTVALVGDSKAMQWAPALDIIGRRQAWRIVTYVKSACAFTDAMTRYKDEAYESCRAWGKEVLVRLLADKPDLVLTSHGHPGALVAGKVVDKAQATDAMADGLHRYWQALQSAGVTVAVLSDTPSPGKLRIPECVAENPEHLTACSFRRRSNQGGVAAQRKAVAKTPGVHWIDLNDAICPTAICPPIIGNALIYRQGSHITATYIKTLAPRLEAALVEVMR
jgi:peptidoglycan/LPS O-acetylase OafA/YrhL